MSLLMLLLWQPGHAALVLDIDPALREWCPTATRIERRWRTLDVPSTAVAVLSISSSRAGLLGRLVVGGQVRQLRAERHGCPALVDALTLSGALLAGPTDSSPRRAPLAGPRAAAAPSPPPTAVQRWRLDMSGRTEAGLAPRPPVSVEVGTTAWRGGLGLGGHLGVGSAAEAPVGATRVALDRYVAGLHGCWGDTGPGLCAHARFGVWRVRSARLGGVDRFATVADLALRAGWTVELGGGWSTRLDAEVVVPLRPLHLEIDDTVAWSAAASGLGAGLSIGWSPP